MQFDLIIIRMGLFQFLKRRVAEMYCSAFVCMCSPVHFYFFQFYGFIRFIPRVNIKMPKKNVSDVCACILCVSRTPNAQRPSTKRAAEKKRAIAETAFKFSIYTASAVYWRVYDTYSCIIYSYTLYVSGMCVWDV